MESRADLDRCLLNSAQKRIAAAYRAKLTSGIDSEKKNYADWVFTSGCHALHFSVARFTTTIAGIVALRHVHVCTTKVYMSEKSIGKTQNYASIFFCTWFNKMKKVVPLFLRPIQPSNDEKGKMATIC